MFAISTSAVSASTAVTITATYNGVDPDGDLTVTPAPPPPQTATLTVTATGRGGERVTSSPAGISVATGSSGSASFAPGTSITLSVTNGRSAIWSGACSSGGNKVRTCTFTLYGSGRGHGERAVASRTPRPGTCAPGAWPARSSDQELIGSPSSRCTRSGVNAGRQTATYSHSSSVE